MTFIRPTGRRLRGPEHVREYLGPGNDALAKCYHDPPTAFQCGLASARAFSLEDSNEELVVGIDDLRNLDREPFEGFHPRRHPPQRRA
jgi:hypothetical protein